MESQIKTVACPNCGANTTNTQYCEYCGSKLVQPSLLTRLNDKLNSKKDPKKFFTTPFNIFANKLLKECEETTYRDVLGAKYTLIPIENDEIEGLNNEEENEVIYALNTVWLGINWGECAVVRFKLTLNEQGTKCTYTTYYPLLYRLGYGIQTEKLIKKVLHNID